MNKDSISIVVCNNEDTILNNYLIKGLRNQNIPHELIIIDNKNRKHSSMFDVIKKGIEISNFDYICFCHNDIEFEDNESLQKIEEFLKNNEKAIVGVAGKTNRNKIYSKLIHTMYRTPVSKVEFSNAEECEVLDEVCIASSKKTLKELIIDGSEYSGWHLYALEMCLQNILAGGKNYVLPIKAYHASSGTINKEYVKDVEKIRKKYMGKFNKIHTLNCVIYKSSFMMFFEKLRLKLMIFLCNHKKLKDKLLKLRSKLMVS